MDGRGEKVKHAAIGSASSREEKAGNSGAPHK